MRNILRIIGIIIGIIAGIITIGNFLTIDDFNFQTLLTKLSNWDLKAIADTLIIIGFLIISVVLLIVIIILVFGIKKPNRDPIDYIVEVLLPEEELSNSAQKHRKNIFEYYLINVGLLIISIGILLVLGTRLF
jgi:hypothetical protein